VSDSAGQPGRDLLDQPCIAVGIGEGEERPVARALWVRAGDPCLGRERRAVPHLTGLDATADQIVVGRFDFRDRQPAHRRARRGRGDSLAERDRGGRTRRGELDKANTVCRGDVIVESPPQPFIELLGSLDIGYGDDVDLRVHVDHVAGFQGRLPQGLLPGRTGFPAPHEAMRGPTTRSVAETPRLIVFPTSR
jgi:hypothetical protein